MEKLPGRISAVIASMLKLFFLSEAEGRSWPRGVIVSNGHASAVLSGTFGGFLGDDSASKEIFCFKSFKGASGAKPCMTCHNVVQFLEGHAGGYLVGVDWRRHDLVVPVADDDVRTLEEAASTCGTKGQLEHLELRGVVQQTRAAI